MYIHTIGEYRSMQIFILLCIWVSRDCWKWVEVQEGGAAVQRRHNTLCSAFHSNGVFQIQVNILASLDTVIQINLFLYIQVVCYCVFIVNVAHFGPIVLIFWSNDYNARWLFRGHTISHIVIVIIVIIIIVIIIITIIVIIVRANVERIFFFRKVSSNPCKYMSDMNETNIGNYVAFVA